MPPSDALPLPLHALAPDVIMDVAAIAVFVQAFSRQLLLVPPPPLPLLLLSVCALPSSFRHSAALQAYEETFTQLLSFVCLRAFPSPSNPSESLERDAEKLKISSTFHDLPCVHWQLLDCMTSPHFYAVIVPSLPAFSSHPLAAAMSTALRSPTGIWSAAPAIKVALLQVLISHICDCDWLTPQFEPLPDAPLPAVPATLESQAPGCVSVPVVTWLPLARKPEAYRHELQPHSRIVPVTTDPWNRSVWAIQGFLIITGSDGAACRLYWTPSSIACALRALACGGGQPGHGKAMLPMRASYTQALQWLLTWSRGLQQHAFSFDAPKLFTWRNQHVDLRCRSPSHLPPALSNAPTGRPSCPSAPAFSRTPRCSPTAAAAARPCPPETSRTPTGATPSAACGWPCAPSMSAFRAFCSGAVVVTSVTTTTSTTPTTSFSTTTSTTSSTSTVGNFPHVLLRREFLYTSAHWVSALGAASCISDLQLLLFELAAAVMPAAVDPVWHSYDVLPTNYGRNFNPACAAFAGASDSDPTTLGMHLADACPCPAPTPFMGSWKARETNRDCGRTVFTWLRRRVTSWPRRRHIGDVRTLVAKCQAEDDASSSDAAADAETAAVAEAAATIAPAAVAAMPPACRDDRSVPVTQHHWSICVLDQLEAWELMRLARSGGRGPSVAFVYPQGAAGALHWGFRRFWMRLLMPQPPPPPDSDVLGKCVADLQLQQAVLAPLSQAEFAFRMRQFERCLRLPVLLLRTPSRTPLTRICRCFTHKKKRKSAQATAARVQLSRCANMTRAAGTMPTRTTTTGRFQVSSRIASRVSSAASGERPPRARRCCVT